MSAFMIFHVTVNDPETFQTYGQGVPATLKEFGGEVFLRGKANAVVSGEHHHQNVAILRFPDIDAATNWYASPGYQKLIPTRDSAANVVAISYMEPPQ